MHRVFKFAWLGTLLGGLGVAPLHADDAPLPADKPWIVFEGAEGAGQGKHVVLVSGDEEYRSEEGLPQLAKILSKHHGFKCTVLFSIADDGTIDPNRRDNIPGLEALRTADLLILLTRFRDLPDSQMKEVADYVESGRPIIGMRTATHAFSLNGKSSYLRYSGKEWPGGFGRQVLGETWVNHHGHHGKEATLGLIAPDAKGDPILRGIADGDIFGPSDVYTVNLPADCKVLVLGQVLEGMNKTDKPVEGKKNDPMMPVAWTRSYKTPAGPSARVFTTTMGTSQDLLSEGFRRLLVNASYWAVGLDDKIPEKANVDIVGDFQPTPFGVNRFAKGVKPEDLKR